MPHTWQAAWHAQARLLYWCLVGVPCLHPVSTQWPNGSQNWPVSEM